MAGWSKPTIHLLPILITGIPVWPVCFWIVRAADASRSTLTSRKGTRLSLKYFFALRHHEQVVVLNNTTFAIHFSLLRLGPVRSRSAGLLALVQLGWPLAGFPYLRVVGVVPQITLGLGEQGRVLRIRFAQPCQQLLPIGLKVLWAVGFSHVAILTEAFPKGRQGLARCFDWPRQ